MTIVRWMTWAASTVLLGLAGPAALAHPGPHDQYGGATETPVLSKETLGGNIAVGMRVPTAILGPDYAVSRTEDWALPTPPPDRRWVRYWDDALLIDGAGVVRDIRRGMDWGSAPQLAAGYDEGGEYGVPYADGDYDQNYWDDDVPMAEERGPVIVGRGPDRDYGGRRVISEGRDGTTITTVVVGGGRTTTTTTTYIE